MRSHLVPLVASAALLTGAGAMAGFETVPDRHPAELLAVSMVSGVDFQVVDPVHGDGLMNHFVLDSKFGKFDAYGRAALAIRIHEVAALTQLARTSDIQVAAGGVVQGVASQVSTATGVVTHPVRTVTGVPKGIAHLFAGYKARADEATADVKRDASSFRGQSSGDGSGNAASAADAAVKVAGKGEKAARSYAERYLGVTSAERGYYQKLGVDPYTDNQPLREAIRHAAKVSAAASFGLKLASLPAIPGIGITQRVVDTIYNEDPAAIRERTRTRLAGYKLSAAEIESFMNAPYLSPTRQVVLLSAAQALDGVAERGELFRHALGLSSNEEVQVYLRSVGLLVKAHADRALTSVVPGVRLPGALRADGSVVVCGAFEAVYWTEDVARLDAQLRAALPESGNEPRELWVAGVLSDRARQAARELGWQLHEVTDQSE